jgi:hypothetical protein
MDLQFGGVGDGMGVEGLCNTPSRDAIESVSSISI